MDFSKKLMIEYDLWINHMYRLIRKVLYVEWMLSWISLPLAQSAGAAEYTNCISAEEYDFPNKCPRYDTKHSLGNAEYPFFFRPEVVAPDRLLSMGQIELFDF